jgi:hypothetical protein
MIIILRRSVARNIWVATLKVNVTAWPCSKIVSGRKLRYLKSDLATISQRWALYWIEVSHSTFGSLPFCVQNLFGEHHPVQPALVWFIFYVLLYLKMQICRNYFIVLQNEIKMLLINKYSIYVYHFRRFRSIFISYAYKSKYFWFWLENEFKTDGSARNVKGGIGSFTFVRRCSRKTCDIG